MNVYVFKTSIHPKDTQAVNSILQSIIPTSSWNYDLEDCDNILRIESDTNIAELVCTRLHTSGFDCEELQ